GGTESAAREGGPGWPGGGPRGGRGGAGGGGGGGGVGGGGTAPPFGVLRGLRRWGAEGHATRGPGSGRVQEGWNWAPSRAPSLVPRRAP
ncbi:hypothetical protein FXF65_17930, partial [Actinomadura syzygii]